MARGFDIFGGLGRGLGRSAVAYGIDFEFLNEQPLAVWQVGIARIWRDGEVRSVETLPTFYVRPEALSVRPEVAPPRLSGYWRGRPIDWERLRSAPTFGEVWAEVEEELRGCEHLVAHNARSCDSGVLMRALERSGIELSREVHMLDTLVVATELRTWARDLLNSLPDRPAAVSDCDWLEIKKWATPAKRGDNRLEVLAPRFLGRGQRQPHDAGDDAALCAELLLSMDALHARVAAATGRMLHQYQGCPNRFWEEITEPRRVLREGVSWLIQRLRPTSVMSRRQLGELGKCDIERRQTAPASPAAVQAILGRKRLPKADLNYTVDFPKGHAPDGSRYLRHKLAPQPARHPDTQFFETELGLALELRDCGVVYGNDELLIDRTGLAPALIVDAGSIWPLELARSVDFEPDTTLKCRRYLLRQAFGPRASTPQERAWAAHPGAAFIYLKRPQNRESALPRAMMTAFEEVELADDALDTWNVWFPVVEPKPFSRKEFLRSTDALAAVLKNLVATRGIGIVHLLAEGVGTALRQHSALLGMGSELAFRGEPVIFGELQPELQGRSVGRAIAEITEGIVPRVELMVSGTMRDLRPPARKGGRLRFDLEVRLPRWDPDHHWVLRLPCVFQEGRSRYPEKQGYKDKTNATRVLVRGTLNSDGLQVESRRKRAQTPWAVAGLGIPAGPENVASTVL